MELDTHPGYTTSITLYQHAEAQPGCDTCGNTTTDVVIPYPPFNDIILVAMSVRTRMLPVPHPLNRLSTHLPEPRMYCIYEFYQGRSN